MRQQNPKSHKSPRLLGASTTRSSPRLGLGMQGGFEDQGFGAWGSGVETPTPLRLVNRRAAADVLTCKLLRV